MKISIIFRKKEPSKNSIEEIFNSISSELQHHSTHIEHVELPYSRISFSHLVKNIFRASKASGDVCHISGDVHYAALSMNRPMVLTIHDCKSILKGGFFKQLFLKIFWFWLPALIVNRITVISEFSKEELSEIIPFARKKITVIYNPVSNILSYKPKVFNNDKPIILQMGTKDNKNLQGTVEAIKSINCKLIIIGKLTQNQMEFIDLSRIEYDNFYHLSFDEIKHYYELCDILCFPSFYEGFGMPIIEAQKVGRPVITSNLGAMKEIAGKSAILVNPNNINEISEALLKIINDNSYRDYLITEGLKNVENFEIGKVTKEYLKLYKNLING